MQEKVTREDFGISLSAYGEEMSREQWEHGTRIIFGYVLQLEDEISKLKGAIPLPFDVSPI